MGLAETILPSYYHQYRDTFSSQVLLEYDFRPHNVTLGDLRLTGKIDKIELLGSSQVNVIDYKTSNPDTKAKALGPQGEYRRQLVFYKLLTELADQFPYTMVSGEIDFLQISAKTGKHLKKRLIVTDHGTAELKKTIEQVWQEIKALRFLEKDVGCGECQYCVV